MTRASEPRVPIRTCVGCRQRRPRQCLVRCVRAADGTVRTGAGLPGRGAWLCGRDCLEAAVRGNGFTRSFRGAVTLDQLRPLDAELAC